MPPEAARARPAAWLLLLPLLGLCFWQLGAVPLFDLDEGAFSAATWEMLQRGDFVTPWLNGAPRFDKPILIYWLQAASVSAFGLSEWALRLPSALAAALWVLAVWRFTVARGGPVAGLLAALFMATSAGVLVIGHAATADAVLNLWLALAMLDLYRHFETPTRALRLRVFLWVGLAVLTKGPIGLLVPGVVSLAFHAVEGRWRDWLRAAFDPLGWVVLLGVALPWYVAEYLAQGQAFIDGFFLKHNLSRFADTMEGHGGVPYYYLFAMLPLLMPWSGAVLALLGRARALWRSGPLARYGLLWFGFVFVFFSFSRTQLPHYLLYGCTPLFVLLALHRDWLRPRWLVAGVPLLLAVAFLALPELVAWQLPREGNAYVHGVLARAQALLGDGYRLWAGLLVLALAAGLAVPRRWQAGWLAATGLAHALFLLQGLLPVLGGAQQAPVKAAALASRAVDAPVVMYRINMPSFIVYRQAVTPRRRPRPGEVVFTRADRLEALGPLDILYRAGGIVLARVPGGP